MFRFRENLEFQSPLIDCFNLFDSAIIYFKQKYQLHLSIFSKKRISIYAFDDFHFALQIYFSDSHVSTLAKHLMVPSIKNLPLFSAGVFDCLISGY